MLEPSFFTDGSLLTTADFFVGSDEGAFASGLGFLLFFLKFLFLQNALLVSEFSLGFAVLVYFGCFFMNYELTFFLFAEISFFADFLVSGKLFFAKLKAFLKLGEGHFLEQTVILAQNMSNLF